MVGHRVRAVTEVASGLGAGAVLLSSRAAVRWVGIGRPRDVHVLISAGGAVAIAPEEADLDAGVEVERFNGRDEGPADAVRRALARVALRPCDRVAIEPRALAVGLAIGLDERPTVGAAAELAQARARKDPDELSLIARSATLASTGQHAVRGAARAGASEVELWGAAQAAMQRARGGPVEAVVDLMAGERTALVGVAPGAYVARDGDPVLFDLAPRREGYWADSCATFSCGPAATSLKRRHDVVRRALERGLETARDGVRAGQVDAAVREVLRRGGLVCPHHTGHGVGAAPQEPPWLVPDDGTVLEEGMVVAVEPGAYEDGFGVRLEHLAVVGPGGASPLTSHSLDPL